VTSARRLPAAALVLAPGPLLAAALALLPLAGLGPAAGPVEAVAGLAVALYVVALMAPLPGGLPWALGLLGVEYLVSLEVRGAPLDGRAPAYAAGLLLCAELGWLGLEARRGGRPWAGRVLAVGALALAGAGIGAGLLLISAAPLPGGAGLTGLGVVASVGIAACLAWLGRR